MKTVKKLFATLLALVMVLSMSAVAFAADTEQPVDKETVTVTKVYKLEGAGSSPAETFTLEQVYDGVVTDGEAISAPALGTITGAEFAAGAATTDGAEANITIELPTYTSVGVYEYTLEEVAGTTAGVAYYGETIKLVVTVVNGADGNVRVAAVHTESQGKTKSDKFENVYSAGSLSVSKSVTGNLGDKDKYFAITVSLTGEAGKEYQPISVTGGSNEENPTTVTVGIPATFYLKDTDTITLSNIPYGVTYEVTEENLDDYTETITDGTGTIEAASQSVSVENEKTGEVDTGISLDSMPYILMLAVAVIGVVALAAKKRVD